MRTSTLLVLSISTAATLVTADSTESGERKPGGGGALQALLERMQKTKHDNTHARRGLKDAQVRNPPASYSDGPESYEHGAKNSTSSSGRSRSKPSREPESEEESVESTSTKSKFVKSTGRPSRHDSRPSPPSVDSSASSKNRLRSTDSARRSKSTKTSSEGSASSSILERQLRAAESDKPLSDEEFDSLTAAEAATTAKSSKKGSSDKKHEDKRWVWGTAILQDDTPAASNVPPVGQNVNQFNTIPVNTPAAALVAPSFPPLAPKESAQSPPLSAHTTTPAARQPIANRKKAAAATAVKPPAVKEKRWAWGTSIIQDDSPDAPPVGENVNLLSSGTTIPVNTPVAVLTPPSFPPLADPTVSSVGPIETPAQENATPEVVAPASSSVSAASPEIAALGTSGIHELLVKLQAEIDALAKVYAQATASGAAVDAAAATSPVENAKRWVWGPSIIQDDTPSSNAPPIGQNTNLFNPAVPVATPTGKPLQPYVGTGRVGLAPVASVPPPVVEAPAPITTPAIENPIVSAPDAASSSSSSVRRNRKSEADSMRSVRGAASKTAALEWHLANQKRQVGGMAKQHKRQ
ncbi:hypothetical protein JCM16303_002531 [Sporobolomyces ruberrimus]